MTTPSRRAQFVRAFLASVLGTGLSRVLGAVRDVVVAGFLGAGVESDAFVVAFTVPNVFRRFVADEGLTGALIPAVARAEVDGEQAMRRLANTVLAALILANLVLCAAGIAGARWLVLMFATSWADQPEKFELAVTMTRWLIPFVTMVSLVSYFEGLLNHRQHFFVPKVAPGLVSAGIAITALGFGTRFEEPVFALVAGTLLGGVAHVLVNLPVLWRVWGPVGLAFDFGDPKFRRVMAELGKVVAIGIFAQINILVLRQLAAALPDGAMTHYWNANRLVDLSQGIIAVAIGSALLPNVSLSVAEKDWAQFREDLVGAFRLAAFLLVPTAVTTLVFARPLTSLLFRVGRYTWTDVQTTALTLQLMVPFLLAIAGINILKKVFFALEDRRTLLAVGAVGVAITGGLGVALVGVLGVSGLALALSISTGVQLLVYVVVLQRRLGTRLGLDALVGPSLRMVAASIPLAVPLLLGAWLGSWELGPRHLPNLAIVGVAVVVAGLAYLGAARLLGLSEVDAVTGRVMRRFRR